MIVSYDFTHLAQGIPPRHHAEKHVLISVVGVVEIHDLASLEKLADIEFKGGMRKELFAAAEGRVFAHVGALTPDLFSDRPGGLELLAACRRNVEMKIAAVTRSAWRSRFHPGGKIESPGVFKRVDVAEAGLNRESAERVEVERQRIEAVLSRYVHMDGEIYLEVSEPFLVVWKNVKNGFGSLSHEVVFDHDFWTLPEVVPLACFRLGEEKAANQYVSSFTVGRRRPLRGKGTKVTGVRKDLLTLDVAAMTLRAAGMRIRRGFITYAEGFGNIETAMLEVPTEAFSLFRNLCTALERWATDTDGIDDAIQGCLRYERETGMKVFSWNEGGPDSLEAMLGLWESRPVEAADIVDRAWIA
jgi:hypothetical protein